MVKSVACLLLFLFYGQTVFAEGNEAVLKIALSHRNVENGKPLYLSISSAYSRPSLRSIDFSALDRDFVVQNIESVISDKDRRAQHLKIRIYPRRTGKHHIPPFRFRDTKTNPIPVNVTQAIDGKNGSIINVDANISETDVWVRQGVKVVMRVTTTADVVAMEAGEISDSELDVTYLPVSRNRLAGADSRFTLHQAGWHFSPLTGGKKRLQLPPVKYIRDGVVTHLFYPPYLELNVKSLPRYLPPTMPVGHFEPGLSLSNRFILVKNKLAYLSFNFGSEGAGKSQVFRSVLRQLRSNREVRFYPVEEKDAYRIPFAVKQTGVFSLPTIRLQYFDPGPGIITTKLYKPGWYIVISQWLAWLLGLLLVTGVSLVLYGMYKKLAKFSSLVSQYLCAVRQLQHAGSKQGCRSALNMVARAESWPENLTLLQWQQLWQREYASVVSVSGSIQQLQEHLYCNTSNSNIRKVCTSFTEAFYRRLPLLRVLIRLPYFNKPIT